MRFFKILGISFFLLLSVVALSQPVNRVDADGKKQGIWAKKFENSEQIRYKGQFRDDEPYGEFVYYYEEGELRSKVLFGADKTSYVKNYYPNGQLMGEGKYLDQKKDSTWKYYGPEGKLASVEEYSGGTKHGVFEVYFPEGKKAEQEVYKEGILHGEAIQWYANGQEKSVLNYKDGRLEGTVSYYYPTGEHSAKGKYNNGKKHGTWLYYHSNGELEMQVLYRNGNSVKQKWENGVFTEEYQSRIPKSRVTYKNGKKDGRFTEFYDAGEWIIEVQRQEGIEVTEEPTERLEGQKVKRVGTYQQDKLHGEVVYYSEEGEVTRKEIYEEGELMQTTSE